MAKRLAQVCTLSDLATYIALRVSRHSPIALSVGAQTCHLPHDVSRSELRVWFQRVVASAPYRISFVPNS